MLLRHVREGRSSRPDGTLTGKEDGKDRVPLVILQIQPLRPWSYFPSGHFSDTIMKNQRTYGPGGNG